MLLYFLYFVVTIVVVTMGIWFIFRHLVLEAKITVPYSKAQVWQTSQNISFLAKWDRSVQEVIPTSNGPLGVGYTFETIAPKKPGQEEGLRMSYRVIEFVPDHRATVLLEQSDMFNNAKWITQFDETPQGTLVTSIMDAEVRFKYFYLVPVLLLNKQALMTDLEYFKEALNKELSETDKTR
jgi:hypothetical protein